MVYRFINRATVEEGMMEMTKKKMLLEHLVVGNLKAQNLTQVYMVLFFKVTFSCLINYFY